MKLVLALIAICFAPCNSKAEPNYLDYYRAIASAEEAVVNGKYAEALIQYKAAFSQFPYSNPIDCYVAAQVASFTDDISTCTTLLRSGISFGLPVQTILSNPHLAPFVNGKMLEQATIDSCWNVYQQRIDKEARAKAIKLIQRDQALVRKYSIYEQNGYRVLKPQFQPVWDSLLQEVISLTKASGFPAQKVIGTMNGDDGLFAIGPNSVFIYYILIHYGNAWPQIGDLLWTELQKGNITPQMYGALAEYSNGKGDEELLWHFSLRPCNSKACKRHLRQNIGQINTNRYEIGLCSYEVMEQKHETTRAYKKWVKAAASTKAPLFDYQPDLHFMGLSN